MRKWQWGYDLPYFVELWDDTDSHVEELIALTGDYRVARPAFDEAVKRRPGRTSRFGRRLDCWQIVEGVIDKLRHCELKEITRGKLCRRLGRCSRDWE